MAEDTRSRLRDRIQELALVFANSDRPFLLASGQKSNFYFDMKKVTMERESSRLIAECLLPLIPAGVDYVGGLETGAVPIVQSLVDSGSGPRYGFFIRKKAKKHGLKGKIEGNFDPQKPVVIVDDVTTTGDSVLKAIRAVRSFGGTVAKVIAVVDRSAGGSERVRRLGLIYEPLFELRDFGISPGINDQLTRAPVSSRSGSR